MERRSLVHAGAVYGRTESRSTQNHRWDSWYRVMQEIWWLHEVPAWSQSGIADRIRKWPTNHALLRSHSRENGRRFRKNLITMEQANAFSLKFERVLTTKSMSVLSHLSRDCSLYFLSTKHCEHLRQESHAIAKMTARCALYMDALRNFWSPGLYAHGYLNRNC